ncbi:MAG: NADH-quinone oxidoreductase subunit L [Armatimonadetes bacterium]|nr:NADH-quinone oxidoreductase subunit L [Armatimonadota bacterium]
MFTYAWLVPGLPLLGTIINGIFGRFLPRKVVGTLASALVGGSFLVSVAVFIQLLGLPEEERHVTSALYTWISAGNFFAEAGILIDPLSVFMMLVVSGVGFFIHVYSTGYMGHDEGYSRYFTYLNLFAASMLILVMANNFLLLFVGWELVGICSYLLISFWYSRPSAVAAGKKAFITTRVGDLGFTLGVVLIFVAFGTLAYDQVFAAAGEVATGVITAITVLLFIGAIGKSAQIPLYVWLPDAMEGPTPVSALIHAATMVTAGVYLVARASPLYVHAPGVLLIVAFVGAVTALFAATIALVNNDIKRVLAYSTISQIGLMFLGVGVGAFAAGLFHLLTHAFFKALLFLGAGSVMHALAGETDIRNMGGLRGKMQVTYWTFLVAGLAIAGIAPLSGFFSKDEILAAALTAPGGHWLLYALGLAASLLTAFYIFRLFFKAFHGEPRMSAERLERAHESPPSMTVPLVVLAIGAAVAGFVGVPGFLAPEAGWTHAVAHFLEPGLAREPLVEAELPPAIGVMLMLIALAVGIAGIAAAWHFYVRRPGTAARLAQRAPAVYNTLLNKYWVDEAYNALFVRPGKALAAFFWRGIDAAVVDGFVNGVARAVAGLSLLVRRTETGYLRNYALAIFAGAVVLVGYLISTR